MNNSSEPSLKGLLAELGENIATLFRNELAVAKAETSENATQAMMAVGAIAAGIAVALAALIVLLQALVIALTNMGIAPGWSALIVGVVAATVAFGLVQKGLSDLQAKNLMPRRTIKNIERDAQTIKEHTP